MESSYLLVFEVLLVVSFPFALLLDADKLAGVGGEISLIVFLIFMIEIEVRFRSVFH